MKKNRSLLCLLALLCALLLSACAASAADSETPDASPQADQTPPAAQETSEEPTLEALLGEDYGNTAQKRCGIKASVVKYRHG